GEQGSGLSGLWGPVGELLDLAPGVDVIADCGRLYTGSPAADVLAHTAAVVLVTRPRDDSSPKQIEQVLRQAGLPVPVLGRVALDPKGAGLLAGDWVGRLDRSLLVRSVREIARQLASRLGSPVTR